MLFFVENAAIACHVMSCHNYIIYKRNVRKYTKKIAPDENSHYTIIMTQRVLPMANHETLLIFPHSFNSTCR